MIRPDHAPVHSSPGTLSQAGFLDLNVRADMFKQNLVTQVEQDLQQEHPQDQPQQEEAYNLQLPEKEAGRFEGSVSGVDAARRMLCRPNAEKIVDQQVSSGAQDKGKGSSVAFHLLLPVLLTDLDRDKGMQLQCIWEKLKIRNALAQTNNQANPSQHSLFSQVSTQQIPSTRVSAWPTDQQTSSRGRMNARPPLTLVNPALTQAKKRARTAADDSDARPEATLPVPGLGKGIQEVGLVVSKMDLTSSAKATVGASATGARACQLGGQQPRLPNWSEMLDRGFSTNHLPDPASDKTKAFMHVG
ncbi:hypothetical protein PR202_gb23626 [Eleusine coracana subsp. coracana]|uniref:Uncharacterized protein n=1 Tax=Eleusine coracana subsp. coracana TaxID=191504 RepID=A0AAV5FJW7_ELECO|nr:hypothetical protein PR202_gb23626 [Eleusine coracana subsp. coracana]